MSTSLFVGQGPNRVCWHRGLESGKALRPGDAEGFARDLSDRLSLTGSVGKKLAFLLDLDLHAFLRAHDRENLNSKWHGKNGKGDKFDRTEAAHRAALIEADPKWTHVVLLGAECARAFGLRFEPLKVHVRKDNPFPRAYFLLPHPSGINVWWNESFNLFRARRRLKEFLDDATPKAS